VKFHDATEERAFLDLEASRFRSRQTVIGFVATASVWVLLALWNWLLFEEDTATVIAIYLSNVPMLLGCALVLAVGGSRTPRAIIDWMPLVAALLAGLSMVAAQAAGPASLMTYVGPMLCPYIICVHSYMALRFAQATAVCFVLIAANIGVALAARVSGGLILTDLVFVLTGQLIGAQISYRTERYRRRDFRQTRALRAEQEKSERLLHNMLPPPIAERLKREAATIADSVDSVTVLFADIVGFTGLSQQMEPAALVELLNRVFTIFDQLAERHGVEKVKTIGDAYMAVGGLTIARPDHAAAVAALALDMRAALTKIPLASGLSMRIGIHSGPVVAGVIGKSKYVYDLWGDTVNTASRMESHGKEGAIQISEATREALGAAFAVEERGVVEIKGKGAMRTYWLGERSE
jgi:class 3 adenylate cyclase